MKRLHVAVIGAGYWGPNIVRNLLAIKNIDQVYACDIDLQKLKSMQQRFPAIRITNNYRELLERPEIHANIIATPIETHFTLAKMAIEKGKHVLVEKPLTENSSRAKDLVKLSKKHNVILMVGHTFVYSEFVKKIKSIVSKGDLGKIFYYDSTRINLGIIQEKTNVIWDLAPHDLSIINYIFPQKILSVQAFGTNHIGKNIETAHIFLKHEEHLTSHINISWLSPVKIRTIVIGGSKKMITIDDIHPSEKIRIYDKGITQKNSSPFFPIYRSGDITIPKIPEKESLHNELAHFADCIIDNKTPITNGTEGLKIVYLLEAIEKSLRLGKEIKL